MTGMEIVHKYFGGEILPEKLIVATLDAERINGSYNKVKGDIPLTSGPVCFIIVRRGWLDISVDKKNIHCSAEGNNFIHMSPFNVIYKAHVSSDIDGMLLCGSKKFLDENMGAKRPFDPVDMQDFQLNPATRLEDADANRLCGLIRGIKEKFSDTANIFRDELICLKGLEFILEFASITRTNNNPRRVDSSSRSDNILKELFPILVDNCRKHHEVTYYAEHLCITPQYLNKLTRTKLGRSASSLIADVLVTEAVLLLQDPQLTIQQISEKLNFSDQSAFGKFFKKNTGQSPLMYRKGLV